MDLSREECSRGAGFIEPAPTEKGVLVGPTVFLDGTQVGDDYPPYIVAEVGHNHLGSVEECKRLFVMARDAGANAVKLQKRDNRELYTEAFFNSPYNSEAAYGPTYGTHREALEFSLGQYLELSDFAKYLKLTFIATPFDLPSVDFLEIIDVPYYKVASGSITNPLLLRKIASLGKPILVSFGGASFGQVKRAVRELAGCPLVLMHCVAAYPPKPERMVLPRIQILKNAFPEHIVGFSDHEDGISLSVAALTLGARVFEKHITMSHSNKGTDHAFSLEYGGLRSYVGKLHSADEALKPREQPLDEEKMPIYKMGSAVYPARPLKAGQIVAADDLVLKSPAEGIPGWMYDELMGKRLSVNVAKDQPLDLAYFYGEH